VAACPCSAPFFPWIEALSTDALEVGLLPPMTSVNSGSGDVKDCDSAVAGEAVLTAGLGVGEAVGAGAAVVAVVLAAVVAGAGADGVAVAAVAVAAVAVGATDGDAVVVGAGVESARAGESVAAVREASVTTSAVSNAVVFRIEFT